jgi:hypothetical protein
VLGMRMKIPRWIFESVTESSLWRFYLCLSQVEHPSGPSPQNKEVAEEETAWTITGIRVRKCSVCLCSAEGWFRWRAAASAASRESPETSFFPTQSHYPGKRKGCFALGKGRGSLCWWLL